MPLAATEAAYILASHLGIYAYVTCQSLYQQDHPLPQRAIFLNTATLCPPPIFHVSAMWGSPPGTEASPYMPRLQTGACPHQRRLLLQNWAGQGLIFSSLLSFSCLKITLINFVESLVCSHDGIALCADLLHAIFRYGFWNTM